MTLAPYRNLDRGDKAKIEGCFQEKDHGLYFEYYKRNSVDLEQFASDFPHRVFVGPEAYDTRCALVKKTVVYVVIDEDMQGKPVTEKWFLKKHDTY